MSSITLTNLRAAVRSRADMVNSTFIDDATETDRWINEAAAELYDLVVSRYEDQFLAVTGSIVVSSGNTISLTNTSNFPAATPFYKLRGVDILISGSANWQPVRMFDFNQRNNRSSGASWYRSRTVRYRVMGSSIYLTPDDGATGTYRVWYIPGFVDLSAGSDTLDYPNAWHEYVIAKAAAKALAKERTDASVQLSLAAEARDRVMTMAPNRDAGARMRIEDVYRDSDDEYE